MKIIEKLKDGKCRDKIVLTIIGLFFLALIIQSAASLGLLLPLSIDDFVIDSHENIVAVSGFHNRIFYISRAGHLQNSFSIPESGGGVRIAIDTADNIYMNRRRGVEVYALNQTPKYYSVDLDKTDDWLLEEGFKVVNKKRTMSYDFSNCTVGNRKPVNFGAFLFQNVQCDNGLGRSLVFETSSKKYVLNSFWNDRVSISDLQGRHLYDVKITPVYLKAFAFPMPFLLVLLALAALAWLINRIAGPNISVPIDPSIHRVNILFQVFFGLVSLGLVAFANITLMSGFRGDFHLLAYAMLVILLLILLLYVKNPFSIWAHLTLQFMLMSFFIYPLTYIPSIKGWDTFAAAVPWPVRLAAYIIPAGLLVLLSSKISEIAFRVRCPVKGCSGWCKRQDLYPVTFSCSSCGKRYITSVYITGRR